jgi:hypothetical protein
MKTYGAGGREPSEVRTNSVVNVSNLMITLAADKVHSFVAPIVRTASLPPTALVTSARQPIAAWQRSLQPYVPSLVFISLDQAIVRTTS